MITEAYNVLENVMKSLIDWMKQPSSVAGASAIVGTLSALGSSQLTWGQAAPLFLGGIVAILLPDNAVAKNDAEALAQAVLSSLGRKEPPKP